MNNIVEKRLFWISQGKVATDNRRGITGELGKYKTFRWQIFSGFHAPKLIKIGQFFRVIRKTRDRSNSLKCRIVAPKIHAPL